MKWLAEKIEKLKRVALLVMAALVLFVLAGAVAAVLLTLAALLVGFALAVVMLFKRGRA